MQRIQTRLLSEDEVERLEAWQKQLPAVLMPPDQETKRERKNRLSKIARRRRIDLGIKFTRPRNSPATKELIMANVIIDEKGCWIWKGCCGKSGYGHVRHLGKMEKVHRLSWIFCNGPIPNGLNALHDCDNPPCCNPAHLFLGTHDDNSKDKHAKKRHYHKVTKEMALEILKTPGTLMEVAKKFSISDASVHHVRKGTHPIFRQCA